MIILEIQKSNEAAESILTVVEQDRNQAEAIYHGKLQYAAVSEVPIHTVVLINEVGDRVKGESYRHE